MSRFLLALHMVTVSVSFLFLLAAESLFASLLVFSLEQPLDISRLFVVDSSVLLVGNRLFSRFVLLH